MRRKQFPWLRKVPSCWRILPERPGQMNRTEPTILERAGTALTEWTETWPRKWESALSGFSSLFDNFGISPRNDLTQGGTHP